MTLLKAPRAAFLSGPRYESHGCNQYVVYLCSQVSSSLEYVQLACYPPNTLLVVLEFPAVFEDTLPIKLC